jgi:hypothetical protein
MDQAASTSSTRPGWHTIIFLLVYYSVAIMNGAIDALAEDGIAILATLVECVNLGLWEIEDARRQRRPIPLSAQPWMVLFAGIAVPVYVIYTRGWRGLEWVVLHGVCYFAVAIGSFYAVVFLQQII